jgi:hypothetical protein
MVLQGGASPSVPLKTPAEIFIVCACAVLDHMRFFVYGGEERLRITAMLSLQALLMYHEPRKIFKPGLSIITQR